MDTIHEKYQALQELLRSYQKLAVAYSSGVDSTFLLKAAADTLGTDNVIALTAVSSSFPKRERTEALDFCRSQGIRHCLCPSDELRIEGFRKNPPNRCYICKKELFSQMLQIASENGFSCLAEGSNMDDNGDYRPGLIAVKELGVLSPLRAAGLYKSEIRTLSKELGLPTWEKQSFACLASRFVYGEPIDEKKLSMVDQAEQLLLDMGFSQFRVRIHGNLARIELYPQDFSSFMEESVRTKVYDYLKELGFSYVTLDLKGYRTGSMNEVLTQKELSQASPEPLL